MDVHSLKKLIGAIQGSYINNFPSAALVLGAHILNVHYEEILSISKGVPIGMLFGDVQTGKTRILEAALSLTGTHNTHMLKKCSDNNFLKMCCQSTLGIVLDDITEPKSVSEKIMLLFDGKPIEINDERFKPRTSFLVSANMECFEKLTKHHRLVLVTHSILYCVYNIDVNRVMSRLVLIPFHSTPSELQLDGPARDKADEQLDESIKNASDSVVSILGMGELLKEAYEVEFPEVIERIRRIMPKANTRLHRSYSWLLFATLKVSFLECLLYIASVYCLTFIVTGIGISPFRVRRSDMEPHGKRSG